MLKYLRDNSVAFIAFVNSQDVSALIEAHDKFGHTFEINDGYVTAVIFQVKEEDL